MQSHWQHLVLALLLVCGLTGCQCCPLTNHYASAVDCIADHEHHLDVFYHPGLDLTRIGRPDWCQCGFNHWLCHCRCDSRKPLPHIVDTSAAAYVGMNCPWNNDRSVPTETEDIDRGVLNELDGQLNEEEVEKALDEIPDSNGDSEVIPLLQPLDDASFEPSTSNDVWTLRR